MLVFFKRIVLLLCVWALTLGCAQASLADAMTDVEAYFGQQEGYSGLIDVPGQGPMRYYAQNDPLWGNLIYEKEKSYTRRNFLGSGCSPSSLAMAIASLIPENKLSAISKYAKQEYSLCSCSINKIRCTHNHTRYVLTSQRDYVRFLPLVFADFATGNNTFGVISRTSGVGTGYAYIEKIAKVYGLTVRIIVNNTKGKGYEEARKLVGKENVAVIALAAPNGAFTNTGHYLFLAGQDEENMYILDPLYRNKYTSFKQGKRLKIIQPGLVSLRHKESAIAVFSRFIVLEVPEKNQK